MKYRRSLVTYSECYTQFALTTITLIISTVYLTFKSLLLEYTAIKGSNEMIENLSITIRCIKIQMMSKNLNNDNIYTTLFSFTQTLKKIHENRTIE